MRAATAHIAARLFDGSEMHEGHAMLVEDGEVRAILPRDEVPRGARIEDHGAGTLCPGFVDLQVNGGGGAMLNDAPSVETLARNFEAHANLGTTALLPTLITDTCGRTIAAIEAAMAAVRLHRPESPG